MLRVLGIDPGSRVTGWGMIVRQGIRCQHLGHGELRLPQESFLKRLAYASISMKTLLKEWQPDVVVFEKIFLGKNADSAFKLGHLRGVLMAEAALATVDVCEYATRVIKKGVVGSGAADKDSVRLFLERVLAVGPIASTDSSDALALAFYHAQRI